MILIFVSIAIALAAIALVVGISEAFDRRRMKREWAAYDAERAAEEERQRLNPGSRPIPGGGVPSASRPDYCR